MREQFTNLGVVDGIALLLCLWFMVRGIFKGFVWQAAGLGALIGGLFAARTLSPKLAPSLRSTFPALSEESNLDIIASYFLIFVAVLLVVMLLARLLKGLIDGLHLASFDRVLGGLFGLLKAGALVVIAVSFFSLFDPFQERIANAYTGRFADEAIQRGGPLFPEEVKQRVSDMMSKLRNNFGGDGSRRQTRRVEDRPPRRRDDSERPRANRDR